MRQSRRSRSPDRHRRHSRRSRSPRSRRGRSSSSDHRRTRRRSTDHSKRGKRSRSKSPGLPKKDNREFHEKLTLTAEGRWSDELEKQWKLMEAEEAMYFLCMRQDVHVLTFFVFLVYIGLENSFWKEKKH